MAKFAFSMHLCGGVILNGGASTTC